jgi:hypothetical protein
MCIKGTRTNRWLMLTLTIAGFVATLALSIRAQAVSTASGITICVNPSGSNGCFMTISAAIARATSGSTITVAGGFYQEAALAIGGISSRGKALHPLLLSIVGAGSPTTIIDASGVGTVVTVNPSSALTLSSVTAQNGGKGESQ